MHADVLELFQHRMMVVPVPAGEFLLCCCLHSSNLYMNPGVFVAGYVSEEDLNAPGDRPLKSKTLQ